MEKRHNAKNKDKNAPKFQTEFASKAPWLNNGPDVYVAGRSHLDGLDALAVQMERKWGMGRLRLLVDAEMREKFDRQRIRLNGAISQGDVDALAHEVRRMVTAWNRLDAAATEAGVSPLTPDIWEAHDANTGEVILICRDTAEAAELVRANRAALVFTLAEIGAILSAYRDITEIKRAFPGSVVRPLGRTRPDPVSAVTGELLPCDIDDEIPF
jgi:hypothetical protein